MGVLLFACVYVCIHVSAPWACTACRGQLKLSDSPEFNGLKILHECSELNPGSWVQRVGL